ncbi:hypothetical protein GCM10009546_12870 [Actinomadura livida]|uniref:Uncharacterized protein n=1 Tax=Actinomadura livida TaxID=79909 RepID=A0ABN1DTY4_9ACTN|nr:hypothetical protein GCM10010208_22220 [Actinomadura livida]
MLLGKTGLREFVDVSCNCKIFPRIPSDRRFFHRPAPVAASPALSTWPPTSPSPGSIRGTSSARPRFAYAAFIAAVCAVWGVFAPEESRTSFLTGFVAGALVAAAVVAVRLWRARR